MRTSPTLVTDDENPNYINQSYNLERTMTSSSVQESRHTCIPLLCTIQCVGTKFCKH